MLVPLPDEGHALAQALMKAVLLRKPGARRQMSFLDLEEARAIDTRWQDAAEKAKRNRTVFAQRRLKPEDVLPEWRKSLAALGGKEDVQRFTGRALARLGGALEPLEPRLQGAARRVARGRPRATRRGRAVGLAAHRLRLPSRASLPSSAAGVIRSFPLPSPRHCSNAPWTAVRVPRALNPGVLGRVGCWVADGVTSRTLVALVRLERSFVTHRGGRTTPPPPKPPPSAGMAPEVCWRAPTRSRYCSRRHSPTRRPRPRPGGDAGPDPYVRPRERTRGVRRAARGRAPEGDSPPGCTPAADARGSYAVKAMLPADIVGLLVLLPRVS